MFRDYGNMQIRNTGSSKNSSTANVLSCDIPIQGQVFVVVLAGVMLWFTTLRVPWVARNETNWHPKHSELLPVHLLTSIINGDDGSE